MSTREGPERLLTLEQLRERWGVSEDTIREHIKHDGLPYVPLGRGGKRPVYRFRLAAVLAWEAKRETHHEAAAVAPEPPPPSVAALWDGTSRLTRAPTKRTKRTK